MTQVDTLARHLQRAWNQQMFPEKWKIIKAVAFPKANKPADNLNNYRIISLLNVFHKVFSKVIKNKLNEHIQMKNLLPEDSYGFREGRGINEYGVRLVQTLENNTKENLASVVIAIDISKAFDRVKLTTLIRMLRKMDVEEKFIYWISEGMKNRELNLTNNQNVAKLKLIVPQGDVLSPMLFNLYTTEVHKIQNEHTVVLQYADDFTIIVKDKNLTDLNFRANLVMRKINNILDTLNFKINPDKCQFMTYNSNPLHVMQIFLNNIRISDVATIKILGITYDQKLNFKAHNREVKFNAYKFMNVLKVFNFKRGGAHPMSMLNVHNALVKSRTTFGAPVTSKNLAANH